MDRNERIAKLLNSLNLGTQKEKVGEFILELVEKVDDLETRLAALEGASTGGE